MLARPDLIWLAATACSQIKGSGRNYISHKHKSLIAHPTDVILPARLASRSDVWTIRLKQVELMNDIVSGSEKRIERFYSGGRKLCISHSKGREGAIFHATAALKARP